MIAPARSTFRTRLSAALAETWLRLLNMTRHPGQVAMDILMPIILAALPILIGGATAGNQLAANFEANTGTRNYVPFLLIGSVAFVIVASAFANIASWLRSELETGTLEAIYLTPTSSLTLASGVALYSAIRSFSLGFVSYVAGCLVFFVNPFEGAGLLALLFVFVGLVPLYGLTFLFGALVLKAKEATALVALMQWVVSFFIGIFFPVTALPPLARAVALLFPPTWMVSGVRSALLGLDFLLGTWYRDLAVLWAFLLFVPLLSVWVFHRVERDVRANEGIGMF